VISYEIVFTKQVHLLGLHVLRSYAQKELSEGSESQKDSFMMLLVELLGDVFLVMQTTLKVLYGILLVRVKCPAGP
jgi:hypothetical protein